MRAGRACASTDRTACFEKKYQTRDFVYPAEGSVGKRDRTSEIGILGQSAFSLFRYILPEVVYKLVMFMERG